MSKYDILLQQTGFSVSAEFMYEAMFEQFKRSDKNELTPLLHLVDAGVERMFDFNFELGVFCEKTGFEFRSDGRVYSFSKKENHDDRPN